MLMTENIDLGKKRRKSIVQKRLLWEMLASSSLIEFNFVSWWSESKDRTLTLFLFFEMRSSNALKDFSSD
jgi:hypothetical protein